ncbi:substrate-binding domain-containing protein [Candidatus Saccharibacteria bacterium]|nr:substrate-binding domain-containing protein [Candidatus Saccharibacteria bacterium]
MKENQKQTLPAEEPQEAEQSQEMEVPKETIQPVEKKKKHSFLPVLFTVLALGSAVGVYFLVSALIKPNKNIVVDELSAEEKSLLADATDAIFTGQTLPRIDASLATQPLTDAFVKDFTKHTTTELNIEYSNTHPAYVKLINNETDLIVVTEPSDDELALAKEKGIELEVTKVVNEGFAFFVNKDNPVSDISFDNVVKIYTGEILNWKDLGGNDAEIIAYQRPQNSGSQTGLYNLVLKGKEVKIPTVKEQVQLSMAGIVDYVAAYDNAIDAIGYGFYYYVNTMYKNENLKYLAIDGVAPTYETIQNGTYPILSAYYIVTRKNDPNENIAKLKKAMLSQRGQRIASEAGYVPVK